MKRGSGSIPPEEYYLQVAKIDVVSESDTEWFARCPIHKDKKRSLSVNKKTGAWICFGACQEGGSLVKFHARLRDLPEEEALTDLRIEVGLEKAVPAASVARCHQRLLKSKRILNFLKQRRGFSIGTIKKFELGFDGDRVWIPIQIGAHYVNVRKYDWKGGPSSQKMFSYDEGYGEARLWPMENLKHEEILLCEGETDCMLANQLGFHAITVTGGAGTWPAKFSSLLSDKRVCICYDIDAAGQKGADKVARALARFAKEIRVIRLPLTEPKNADLTDYIVGNGYAAADLQSLLTDATIIRSNSDRVELDITAHRVSLHEASDKKFYLKRVEVPVIVSGKDLAPYFVPRIVKLSCGMGLKKCAGCGLGPAGAHGDLELTIEHPADILQLIGVPDSVQQSWIRRKAGIVNCSIPQLDVTEARNVEEVRVIPEIEFSSEEVEYVTRQVFVLQHRTRTNTSYVMRGTTVPNPKTQYVTQVVHEMEPSQLSIDQFQLTPQLLKQLRVFQPSTKQSIQSKLADIYRDFTYNVTQIYGREDMLQALDLVFYSVIRFKFAGRMLTRGWTECLVIGDARCGKSETIERMINHYQAGELVTGENTSFAGLIGGMQQTQNRWSISWGKIALADRRLIAIDELSGMEVDQIALMSGVRSSGVAEIVKIQSERTRARTRLIWASNPRSGRRLDSYNHGVLAVKELIGRVEDVARLDIVVVAASGEVSPQVIREERNTQVKHRYDRDVCNSLVLWAWSRRPHHVKFTKGAERAVFDGVDTLDKKYSSAIPLVEPAEQRLKIARLAVAMACRLFSTRDGEIVDVREEHVAEVLRFLQQCYDKPSMGYDQFSAAIKRIDSMDPSKAKQLAEEFRRFSDWPTLRDLLLDAPAFRRRELVDQVGYDVDQTRDLFRWLGRHRLVRSTPVGYVKSAAFTAFLKSEPMQGGSPSSRRAEEF